MSNEIQTTNGPSTVDAWQPQNMTEAMKLAETVSKSGLVPDALRGKSADTLLVMLKGRELGLTVMQSLGNIHVIKGKAELSAAMMRGLVTARHDICKYFQIVESSAKTCRVETLRVGHPNPSTFEFSMEDAKTAGLTSNPNYTKFPAAMLLARCSAIACRAVYSDLVAGVYVEGEVDHPTDPDLGRPVATARDISERLDPANEITPPAETNGDLERLSDLVKANAKKLGIKANKAGAALLKGYGVETVEDLSAEQLADAIASLGTTEEEEVTA